MDRRFKRDEEKQDMILVDTSVWIDFLRGDKSAQREILHRLIEAEEDIAVTEIIVMEILQGIKGDKDFQTVKEYLLEFPIYSPKGIETYLEAARIYRECRKRGKTVRKTIDCIFAVLCLENKVTVFQKVSDFDHIVGFTDLKVLNV